MKCFWPTGATTMTPVRCTISRLIFLTARPPPFYIAYGGDDFPRIIESNRRMIAALNDIGAPVRTHREEGATHFGLALRMENPASPVTATLCDWLKNGPSGFDEPAQGTGKEAGA